MNKHQKYYCALTLFVVLDLIAWYTLKVEFPYTSYVAMAHVPLYNTYLIVKGYKLVPLFQRDYPELYAKYSDIRFEWTAASFPAILSRDGVEMDDVLKAEAREMHSTRLLTIVLSLFWMFMI